MRRCGSKQVSKAHNRTALAQVILARADLGGLSAESLSRSYGVAVPDIDRMIAAELARRGARG